MNAIRFDTLARSLGLTTVETRRRALAATLGTTLALALGISPPAIVTAKKKACPPCKKRKKGKCKKKLPDGTACAGGTCVGGSCRAATCADGYKNGSETGVDCGGSCPRCATGQGCAGRNDCASAACVGGTCQQCSGSNCANPCSCSVPEPGEASVCLGVTDLVGDCNQCPPETVDCRPFGEGTFICVGRCPAP